MWFRKQARHVVQEPPCWVSQTICFRMLNVSFQNTFDDNILRYHNKTWKHVKYQFEMQFPLNNKCSLVQLSFVHESLCIQDEPWNFKYHGAKTGCSLYQRINKLPHWGNSRRKLKHKFVNVNKMKPLNLTRNSKHAKLTYIPPEVNIMVVVWQHWCLTCKLPVWHDCSVQGVKTVDRNHMS